MKRYYFGVLLVCLAAPACTKQKGTVSDEARAQRRAAEQQAAQKSSEAQASGSEAYSETKAEADEWQRYDDAAKREKMGLPPHREKRETAATGAAAVEADEQAVQEPSYGNPPGAYTAPGTTPAVTPSQGTSTNTETMRGTDVQADSKKKAPEQGTRESDRLTTQRIRRAILDDDSLSYTAKNIQITTRNGNITLKGMVLTDKERWEIERKARSYAGSGKVDNLLEIKTQSMRTLVY